MSIFVSQVCHSRHFFTSRLCPSVFLLSVCSFFLFVFKLLVYADYDPYAVAGVCNDHGKTYALYAITVHRRNPNGEEMWKTYRRYSDFHDFHMRITEQVIKLINLSKVSLEGAFSVWWYGISIGFLKGTSDVELQHYTIFYWSVLFVLFVSYIIHTEQFTGACVYRSVPDGYIGALTYGNGT